jgi:hypothetical protein
MNPHTNKAKKTLLIGLDLGQQYDYTVLSVLETAEPKYYGRTRYVNYALVELQRAPLNVPYPKIVDGISKLTHNYLALHNYTFLVDYTGVGRPVVDMLREQQINVIAINTTGGIFSNWKSGIEVSVPKKDIVTSLKATLESNRLQIIDSLTNYSLIIQEFVNFTEKKNEFANLQFEAKYGYHDDIVMSIGLAIWYGENRTIRNRKMEIMAWE